jgi:hypothetical protein
MKAIAHKIVPIRIGLGWKILKKLHPVFIIKLREQTGSRINIQIVDELLNNEKR